MAPKKAAAKKAAPAKKAKAAPAKKMAKSKPSAQRAAEVEANLGGSQPLRDFLNGAGWH